MKRLLPWGLLLGLSFHPAAQGQTPPDTAPQTPPPPALSDLILTNGDILTLDERKPSAQAVAIKGARIVAVGRTKEILARWKSDSTEVVDLGGKTLVPGFIESWGEMSRLGL
ncbi:MAG: hypothetical protein LWW92_08525, partial [Rhodocyclales bacterium]|nr:hypothetical protein [Rhodocyclales bacterium]